MAPRFELLDLTSGKTCVIERSGFLVGRSTKADLPLLDTSCSRKQFQFIERDGQFFVESLSKSTPTSCDGEILKGSTAVRDGMLIAVSAFRFRVQFVAPAEEPPFPANNSESGRPRGLAGAERHEAPVRDRTLPGIPGNEEPPVRLPDVLPLGDDVIIGRGETAGVCLPHIQVSERHARIRRRGNTEDRILQDLGSTNGTFINGRRIVMPELLKPGSMIGIGPFSLTYTGSALVSASRTNNLQLEAVGLVREVPQRILDEVSLVIRPKEFVCLLGPTGSGKTTLLNALSARQPADQGTVLINQTSLYDNFESLKHDIAVVPQRDILHELLSLENALRYTAKLRLPADTSAKEIADRVTETLAAVGLTDHRGTAICELSGGQRRRASLASELLANPSLLFLDEVTSGLDEQTDREMMQLFRRIAESGKTVVCVTHTLANIEESCHLVVLLTVGGKLAFVGKPREAIDYFEINRLGHVYEKLMHKEDAGRWQQRFQNSRLHACYVTSRRSAGAADHHEKSRARSNRGGWRDYLAMFCHQLPLLSARYLRVFAADRRALVGLTLQCLIVALVMYLVFGGVLDGTKHLFQQASHACNMLFVLAVSCFWFGCNNSAKEIVKERAIYTKELQANLDPGAYHASKFILQCSIASLQSLVLLAIVSPACNLPGDNWATQGTFLVLAAMAGVSVGLFISAASTSEEMALTLVPLVLIPQIILSDIFVELEGISRFLGEVFVTNFWAYGALRGTLPEELVEQLNPPLAQPLPMLTAVVAIALHVSVLFAASVLILHVRDRTMASSKKSLRQALREVPVFCWLLEFLGIGSPVRH